MALSRDDFAAAYAALATKAKTPKDVKHALREQQSLLDKGKRATLAELLATPVPAQLDLRSDRDALDALGDLLVELEIMNEPELERLVATFLSRSYRKTLPAMPVPKSLDKYDVEWEVGRGHSGTLYRGRRDEAPHEIAIKVFRADAKPDASRAKAMVGQSEPGLVPVYDAGDDYLVMAFVEGTSIERLLAERKLSLRHGFELIEKAANILAPLHAKVLAHGSLGPGSLLLDHGDAVHVADFGLQPGSPTDDVFALGAVLYEIAAGVPPYEGFHSRELKPPSRYNASAGGSAEAIILKSLARDASRRYPNAAAMAADLGKFMRHKT